MAVALKLAAVVVVALVVQRLTGGMVAVPLGALEAGQSGETPIGDRIGIVAQVVAVAVKMVAAAEVGLVTARAMVLMALAAAAEAVAWLVYFREPLFQEAAVAAAVMALQALERAVPLALAETAEAPMAETAAERAVVETAETALAEPSSLAPAVAAAVAVANAAQLVKHAP